MAESLGPIDYSKLRRSFDSDDEAEISFTATEASYAVGTNANAASSGSWPTGTTAKNTLFYATQDCFIRFADGYRQHRLLAGTYYRFGRTWSTLYVVRVTDNGTLYVWIEG